MLPAAREPWWRTPATRTAISLTSHQAEQLDAIYRESWPIRRRLRRQLTTQQKLVAKMLSAGLLDDEHVRPVIDRLIAIDRECNAAWRLMVIRMYPILTPNQRANLDGLSGRPTRDATHHPFFGRVSGKE